MAYSTIALVVKGFTDTVRSIYSGSGINLFFVYDEGLSYESSIARLRSNRLITKEQTVAYPLFSFRRSVLHRSERTIPRAYNITPFDIGLPTDDYAKLYKASYGAIDIEWFVLHTDESFMESFEIDYLDWDRLHGVTEYSIDIPGVSADWTYQTYFSPDLESFDIQVADKYYKALKSHVEILGWFLSFSDQATYPKIKEINLRILQYRRDVAWTDQVVLETDQITPADLP